VADEVTGFVLRMQLKARDDAALERNYQGARASHPSFSATGGPSGGGAAAPAQRPKQRVAVGYSAPASAAQKETERMKARQAQEEAAAAAAAQEGAASPSAATSTVDQSEDSAFAKVGRNEPCPCGSGKKFKQCHGKA
jgi:hypothetical protein